MPERARHGAPGRAFRALTEHIEQPRIFRRAVRVDQALDRALGRRIGLASAIERTRARGRRQPAKTAAEHRKGQRQPGADLRSGRHIRVPLAVCCLPAPQIARDSLVALAETFVRRPIAERAHERRGDTPADTSVFVRKRNAGERGVQDVAFLRRCPRLATGRGR